MSKTIDMVGEYIESTAKTYSKWLKESKRELNFTLHDQWRKEDRDAVEREGRPALTFDKVSPIIRLISGYQRQNRQDIKVVGVEGGDDFVAEIMTLLIKNIMTRSYGEYKVSNMFLSGIRTSRGWIEPELDHTDDPVNGIIKLRNDLYYEVFPDPDYTEYDMSDAEFLLKRMKITKAKMINLFPEKEKLISRLRQVASPFDEITVTQENPDTGNYREVGGEPKPSPSERRSLHDLVITWYKKYEKKLYLMDLVSGSVKDVTDQKLTGRDRKNMLAVINRNGPQLAFLQQRVGVPWIAISTGGELFSDNISPLWPHVKTFPLVPYVAAFTPEARTPEKIFQGLVKVLIDPQMEINKRRSQLLNFLGNAPWVGDEKALSAEGWDALEKNASSPRLVLKKRQGFELRREAPVINGQEYLALVREGSDTLKESSGVNTDLLGIENKQTVSGKALGIRQQAGMMVIQDVFDNLRYSRHILGRLLVGMILNSYTPEKVVRVCGERQPVYDEVGNIVDEKGKITYQEAEQVLKNFGMLKYDLAMDESQMSPVMRMAVMDELLNMRKEGIPIPADLVIDASSLPNRDEVKKRIKEEMLQAQQAQQFNQGG